MGGQEHHPGPGRESKDPINDVAGGLTDDRDPGFRAERLADMRVEEPEVIVDFGGGGDDGARARARAALLDGDGGGEPLQVVHLGFLHLVQKLPRIGRERFDVFALPFGIDGVEGEGRFAGTAQAGNDHQLIPRDSEREVLEVMFPRSANPDEVLAHGACGTVRLLHQGVVLFQAVSIRGILQDDRLDQGQQGLGQRALPNHREQADPVQDLTRIELALKMVSVVSLGLPAIVDGGQRHAGLVCVPDFDHRPSAIAIRFVAEVLGKKRIPPGAAPIIRRGSVKQRVSDLASVSNFSKNGTIWCRRSKPPAGGNLTEPSRTGKPAMAILQWAGKLEPPTMAAG